MPARIKRDIRQDIPTGTVEVRPLGEGWYFVQIGRGTGTKRFNLRDTEARQLVEQLNTLLPDLRLAFKHRGRARPRVPLLRYRARCKVLTVPPRGKSTVPRDRFPRARVRADFSNRRFEHGQVL